MKRNRPVTIAMIALLGLSLLTGCTSATGMTDGQIFVETEASAADGIGALQISIAVEADESEADATSSQSEVAPQSS